MSPWVLGNCISGVSKLVEGFKLYQCHNELSFNKEQYNENLQYMMQLDYNKNTISIQQILPL